jgi:hypothetical protein
MLQNTNLEENRMNADEKVLPVSAEFVSPRRCRNQVGCDNERRDCGWYVFDEVVILAEVSTEAPTQANEVLRYNGFACRSCGSLQPDGIPAEVIAKLTAL